MTTIPGRDALASSSADATERIGEGLASGLESGDVILLEGDLAAGKTTLVRGLVSGLGGDPRDVDSPTFILLQTYRCGVRGVVRLHHVDLYRLGDGLGDLREIGIEEVLSDPDAVVAVEWPKDTLATWIPADARVWTVSLTANADDTRTITIEAPK